MCELLVTELVDVAVSVEGVPSVTFPVPVIVVKFIPLPDPTDVTVPLFVAVIVGLPLTPLPLLIDIPVPAVIVLPATVFVPVLAISPLVLKLCRANA